MGQEVLFPRRSPSAGLKEYTVSRQEPFCKHQHSSFADKMLLVLEMGGRAGRCRVISVLKELLSSLDHEPGIQNSKPSLSKSSEARGKVILHRSHDFSLLPPIQGS